LRNRTSRLILAGALALALSNGVARAKIPSLADVDAIARASGNRIDIATRVGESIFSEAWPAQVSQISANEIGSHLIVGVRLWGVKFHRPVSRQEFVDEVASIVEKAFASAPAAEEVDVWASIPIEVAKGVVVSGDLAMPTTRTVFSLAARRGESVEEISTRASGTTAGIFWDQEWARAAFKKQGL
jgi:hypothetical protein